MAEPDPVAAERKLRARRNNERVRLTASSLNTLALAILGAAFVIPGVISLSGVRWPWIPVAFLLHLAAQAVHAALKSED